MACAAAAASSGKGVEAGAKPAFVCEIWSVCMVVSWVPEDVVASGSM
jgi:hypothetical protein